jgi:uncharacterized membrane protein
MLNIFNTNRKMNNSIWFTLLYIAFGILLIVPGILSLQNEKKKPVAKQQDLIIILSYVLICLGIIIALGIGKTLIL